MPSRHEIQAEITSGDRQDVVRRRFLNSLYKHTGRNVIIYSTAYTCKKVQIQQIPDMLLSVTTEDIQGFMSAVHKLKGDELDIIIHSPGGSAEATEQIVNYLRSKFKHIRAIIPQNAMSAATMLACACDEIIMARHSALGPIDPQMGVVSGNGSRYFIAAQSILDEFEQAKVEVNANPKLATLWVNRINSYPHGFFKKCEDTIKLAKTMVETWLNAYMFATDHDKKGKEIADWLGSASEHLTHGKPIDITAASAKGLKITQLEDDQKLQDIVLSIFHATMVTFDVTPCVKLIENHNGNGWFSLINVKK
jgi:ATP-dependent protease ClpP protease subunit